MQTKSRRTTDSNTRAYVSLFSNPKRFASPITGLLNGIICKDLNAFCILVYEKKYDKAAETLFYLWAFVMKLYEHRGFKEWAFTILDECLSRANKKYDMLNDANLKDGRRLRGRANRLKTLNSLITSIHEMEDYLKIHIKK